MTPRIAPVPRTGNPDHVQELIDPVTTGPTANVFLTFAHHPGLFRRWLPFAGKLLMGGKLPAREREMVVLRTARRCGSDYEWGQHVGIAREAELTEAEIDRVAAGPDAAGWSRADRALLQAADELHDDQVVADATWDELSLDWDTQQLMDIVFTVGIYTQIAMALRSFGVQREDGGPGLPDDAG